MNTLKKSLLAVCIIPFLFSCASIVSKSNWPFFVDSDPAGAQVTIINKKGTEIFKGRTPADLTLKSGAGFFSKESYIITLSMNGYETKKVNVECKLNGWYLGNILLGGLVGMLIVDPATGAMYKLDKKGISETLYKTSSGTASLNIIDMNKVPKDLMQYVVKIN